MKTDACSCLRISFPNMDFPVLLTRGDVLRRAPVRHIWKYLYQRLPRIIFPSLPLRTGFIMLKLITIMGFCSDVRVQKDGPDSCSYINKPLLVARLGPGFSN